MAELTCDCGHVWDAHSDRALYACCMSDTCVPFGDSLTVGKRVNCNCPGWHRTYVED